MRVLVQVWIWYLLTVSLLAVLFAHAAGGLAWPCVAVHLGLLGGILLLGRLNLGGSALRWAWGGSCLAALVAVFSSIGLLLPAINPEPHEYVWIALDRWLLGCDPTVAVQGLLHPVFAEVLQWAYFSFYLMPISVTFAVIRRPGREFEVVLTTITFCFLLSYLGYFIWPTLPPRDFLFHAGEIHGVWLLGALHGFIDQMELNRWDCFPSGHTMLGLVSLVLARRHCRPLFRVMLLPVLLMISSTVFLRYHYVSDVLAGALLAVVGLWLADRMLREIP